MTAPLDPDQVPVPILVVRDSGAVTTNGAFEQILGHHELTRDLGVRFDVAAWGGKALEVGDLPWERVLRQSFMEQEIWYDRETSSRYRYCVRGRSIQRGGILVFEDLTPHAMRLAELLDVTTRSSHEASLDHAAAMLAREVAGVVGADAVFLFATGSERLVPLASSRADLPARVTGAALDAARTHRYLEIAIRPDSTCDATRALHAAGLRSLAALPLATVAGPVGVLVIAWHHDGMLLALERRIVDAVSTACASALARTRGDGEAATLHRLRAAALSIRELPTVHRVLEQLVDQACELVGARGGAVGIAKPDAPELADVVATSGGEPEPHLRGVLQDLVLDGHAPHHDTTHVGLALRVGTQAIGSMCVFDKRNGGPFSEADAHMLELFGAQAALAIDYSQQVQRAVESQRKVAGVHDELAASIAHDMRTPISSVLLQLDLLLECGERHGNQIVVPTASLQRLRDAGWRISRMVDDLLDASRIELRRVALDRHEVKLPEAIANLVAQLEPTLGGRQIRLDMQAGVPPVSADPLRLDEIMTNLLENAAKYSDAGRPITVHVRRDGDGATLTVEDEGAGIIAEEIPRLFDRYFQSKRPRAKKSGLGIGLYITKGLVEAHGGRVWVDSRPGLGSKFHVWLPCAADDEPAALDG